MFLCSSVERNKLLGCNYFLSLFCLSPPPLLPLVVYLRLGIRKEDLPKYEEELELKVAKAQLEELKKDALEAMETQKKRYY